MPKIIPTVIKSGFTNTSSLSNDVMDGVYEKNAKKIKEILQNR